MQTNSLANIKTKEQIIHLREQHKRGEVRIIDDNYASIAVGALANGHIGTFQSFAVLSASHEWLKNTLLTMDLKSMSGDGCFMADGQITLQNPTNCDRVPSRRLLSEDPATGAVTAKMECDCKEGVDGLFSGTTKHRALVTYKGEHFTEALKRGVADVRFITEEAIVVMSALVMEPACGGWWATVTKEVTQKYGYDKVDRLNPKPAPAMYSPRMSDEYKQFLAIQNSRRSSADATSPDDGLLLPPSQRRTKPLEMWHLQVGCSSTRQDLDKSNVVSKYANYEVAKVEHELAVMEASGKVDHARLDVLSVRLELIREASCKEYLKDAVRTLHPTDDTLTGSDILFLGNITGTKVD